MFPSKYLIINADDFNLTRGVDRAILECHDKGLVTSTTVLVTLPFLKSSVKELRRRPFLGKGIHLSLTLGEAVHPKTPFPLKRELLKRLHKLSGKDVEREYEAQILKFKKLLGEFPSHMDTHHHVHIVPNILSAVRRLSAKYDMPYRLQTHHLFEDLDPKKHWTREKFAQCLRKLPSGISEIMVHPGFVGAPLRKISSFLTGRNAERKLLQDAKLRSLLDEINIKLINFNDLAYFKPLYEKTSHSHHQR